MLDVYKTCYRLKGQPFRLSPDYHFSFGHRSYDNAKAHLKYAISEGEGFVVITGGAGTGKTILISALQAEFNKTRVKVATLVNTQLDSRRLVNKVVDAFGLNLKGKSEASSLSELEKFLKQQRQRGRRAILIVDEAQSMSPAALEELRLLSNLQHDNRLLLQVFLVGQEHLLDMIHAPGMEQLHQRLIAASHLEPLDLDETVAYVEHRLCHVGWQGDPSISEDALRLIHKYSAGVPRRINLICHRLFLYGGLQRKNELIGEDARHTVEELLKENLLVQESSDEACVDAAVSVQAREADTPALSLPRTGSFMCTDKSRQPSMQAVSESPMADVQPLSVLPEPENEGFEPSGSPPGEHDRDLGESAAQADPGAADGPSRSAGGRTSDESLHVTPLAPDPAPRVGWRCTLITAVFNVLLTGLVFSVAIETGVRDQVLSFIVAIPTGTDSRALTGAARTEYKDMAFPNSLAASVANSPDRLDVAGYR